MAKPGTVGELRQSGYGPRSVKEELRHNLIRKLESGERLFDGIVGYDESVIPQIENAVLSGQDIVFLGERGQAKTRLARSLVSLLDDEIPMLAGCEINDDPFAPICQACRETIGELGDRAPLAWLPRDRRYGEKLATPDPEGGFVDQDHPPSAADGYKTTAPDYMREMVVELPPPARRSSEISQR